VFETGNEGFGGFGLNFGGSSTKESRKHAIGRTDSLSVFLALASARSIKSSS
jgi:hypothetical protein